VQGLPRNKQALTLYTKGIINSLGLMNVLYNNDGELNEDFVGVGYASDKEINEAAKQAADYFKSADFKSGMNTQQDYIDRVSDEIKLKKDMYKHLSTAVNDVDIEQDERSEYADEYKNLERAEKAIEKAKRHKYLNSVVKRADGFWTKQTAKNIGYGV